MAGKTEQTGTARERIVAAARSLMQGERAEFSMRELAVEAGVSIATPYNLFGSKSQIVSAVVDEDLRRLSRALLDIEGDPLEAFFKVVDQSAEIMARAPALYKAGSRVIGEAASTSQIADEESRRAFHEPRFLVLRGLVADAVQAGVVSHKINHDAFAIQMGQTILSWILTWGNDQITLEEMRVRASYAVALTLSGVVSDERRGELLDRAFELQDALQKIEKEAWAELSKPAKKAAG